MISILAEKSGESTARIHEFSEIHIWGWTSQVSINKWGGTLADWWVVTKPTIFLTFLKAGFSQHPQSAKCNEKGQKKKPNCYWTLIPTAVNVQYTFPCQCWFCHQIWARGSLPGAQVDPIVFLEVKEVKMSFAMKKLCLIVYLQFICHCNLRKSRWSIWSLESGEGQGGIMHLLTLSRGFSFYILKKRNGGLLVFMATWWQFYKLNR